ncbi:hypothetical protein niasHT_003990 [Heterodera trifolii]|uniref:DNA-directed DNA polymerase n=1 Tax=Heterodera trifolii TaxID=157864 RepID=A0ABD2LX24_9BILA
MQLGGYNQRRITFKDSVNFFFCELDALVKSFNLPQHLATVKPFFPYMFIKRQHLLERLAGLPGLDYYQPDTMKAEKRAKLLRWHTENNNNGNRFQLREQLIMYCCNDVAILRESVIRFRHLIEQHAQGLDPFICVINGGWSCACHASSKAAICVDVAHLLSRNSTSASLSLNTPGRKCSARAGPLVKRTLRTPDTALMGFGTATRPFVLLPSSGWVASIMNLHGCELHVVWSCQWAERLRHDPELKRRYDAVFVPLPAGPAQRRAQGGRTEPFKLHHVCSEDEEILYKKIIRRRTVLPVGNPRVVTREVLLHPPTAPLPWTTPENNSFRGLLLVRVLAPRCIRVPLLGYRTKDGRFTFPLCGWCADRRQQRPCRHGDDRRSWVTAYTHVELNKALQLGYMVTDLFEQTTSTRSSVSKCRRLAGPKDVPRMSSAKPLWRTLSALRASGWDSSKVEFNPGLRLIDKTLANSLWGKLAQRVGQTEIRYTRTPAEFHALLDDPTLDKLDFVHVSDHMDRCVVRKRAEFAKAPLTNCLPVACLRHIVRPASAVQLHGAGVGQSTVRSCSTATRTPSTNVKKMCGPCVTEGEALGQMKREHSERRIVEFIAGGPKNYGIRHTARDGTDERANLKIRSFRLSYAAEQLINFEAMKDLTLSTYNIDGPIDDVLDNDDDPYVYGGGEHRAIRVNFPQIARNVPYYAKGRVRPGMQTRPFGYVEDGQPERMDNGRSDEKKFGLNTDNVDHPQLVDAQCDALGVLDAPQNASRHFTRTAWVGHSGEGPHAPDWKTSAATVLPAVVRIRMMIAWKRLGLYSVFAPRLRNCQKLPLELRVEHLF